MSAQCSGTVWEGCHGYACGKPAKVEVDGKWFCGIHNPARIETRRAAQEIKWEAKRVEMGAKFALAKKREHLADCAPALLAALQLVAGDEWGSMSGVEMDDALSKARAAIKQATRGQS